MGLLVKLFEWIGLCLGAVIAGMAVAFLLVRARITRHVEEELGHNAVLMTTTAWVGAHDGHPETASGPSVSGMLMLITDGLYFHSWIGSREVFVPGPSISWLGVSEARGGFLTDRRRIVVRFLNAAGKEDGVFIRILYPEQWVAAIKTHLITRV
jgi:hypothetical protein